MKKLFKVLGILVLVVVLLAFIGAGYLKFMLPNVGAAPEMTVGKTDALVQRGYYLANHVAVCIDCHSVRDWSRFAGPLKPETFGAGGEKFSEEMDLPGNFYSKNLTPAGIGNWTDGELYRAITMGVSKDGEALFNLMPYEHYRVAPKEDIEAIIAYLRTLEPIENEIPERNIDFPLNLLVNTLPAAPDHKPRPDKSNKLEYGAYLVNMASCKSCHTPFSSPGTYDTKMEYAGGFDFKFPNGNIVRSANITPDAETGIGGWSEEMFIQRFKQYKAEGYEPPAVDPDGYNTTMPWLMYSGMEEEDLSAIYTYLKSLKPISNQVVKFTPAGG